MALYPTPQQVWLKRLNRAFQNFLGFNRIDPQPLNLVLFCGVFLLSSGFSPLQAAEVLLRPNLSTQDVGNDPGKSQPFNPLLLQTRPAFQTAQQVGTLPPPPPVLDFGRDPLPTVSPNTVDLPRERVFQAPINSPTASPQPAHSRGYRVYIEGDSGLLLEQVRRIEPGAFVQNHKGRRVIQAGSFEDQVNAQQRVDQLERQGIQAKIARSSSGSSGSTQSSGYFVVVPASRDRLPELRNRAIQLGLSSESVRPQTEPFGPHLRVGPFAKRDTAERWNRSLRGVGMDARVYFSR